MRVLLLLVVVSLAACSKSPTAISFLDHVVTVEEFMHQPDLLKRVQDVCGANPGQLMNDPNCINASTAVGRQAMGDKS